MNRNRHEAHYTIFCTPLFLPPSHIKYSPHHLLLQTLSLFFSWCKTPNFTPTKNDSNNVSCIAEYMQHSELNCSKYCLKLFCSFSQDHAFNISYTRLTTKWQWYFTSTVTYNTNCSTLYHKDCSQSILHSPTVSLIQIIREATNSEYLLNVKNTQQKHINCSSMVITWSAIGSRLSFSATSVTLWQLSFKTNHHIFTKRKC